MPTRARPRAIFAVAIVSVLGTSCPRREPASPGVAMAAVAPPAASLAAPRATASAAPSASIRAATSASASASARAPAPLPPAELVAIAKETWVYEAPRFSSRKLGYLRAGAVVQRARREASREGCPEGFYRVEPAGYVCVGGSASLDVTHEIASLASERPDLSSGLPYAYAMARFPPPPLYGRLPTPDEQASIEERGAARAQAKSAPDDAREPAPAPPPELADGRFLPAVRGLDHASGVLVHGRALPRSGFALLRAFEADGRRFGLTTDFDILPLERTRPVEASRFHGVVLGDELTLPVAFVRARHASLHALGADAPAAGELGHREVVALTGRSVRAHGELLHETKGGAYVRDDDVVVIPRATSAPGWAGASSKWLDVSILRQALVAYEGMRPVYVTLVSTGADGLGDPETTHSTVLGVFGIHTKHVAITMDGDEAEDRFDLRDVPYVQYFHEGYALHAAYWHDDFGKPHSHGCVNLAPIDAAWLFGWTTPDVPEGWHGVVVPRGSTVVWTHP